MVKIFSEKDHGAGEDRAEEDREHKQQASNVLEAAVRVAEKGTGAFCLMRCGGGRHHFL